MGIHADPLLRLLAAKFAKIGEIPRRGRRNRSLPCGELAQGRHRKCLGECCAAWLALVKNQFMLTPYRHYCFGRRGEPLGIVPKGNTLGHEKPSPCHHAIKQPAANQAYSISHHWHLLLRVPLFVFLTHARRGTVHEPTLQHPTLVQPIPHALQ